MIKILIVDDNIKRAEKLKNKIQELDNSKFCLIEHASYSNEAEELLKLKLYDLVILDVVLPKKENDVASPKVGLNLLKRINKPSSGILSPRKIIGITGYIGDIEGFKEEFDNYTSNILEAKISSAKWINNITRYIDSIADSSISVENIDSNKLLVTFHGIRTFGLWQDKLEKLVQKKVNSFQFEQLKYHYFSIFFFLFPFFRNKLIKSLQKDFERILKQNSDKKIYIVTHSFGTYVAVKLLENTEVNVKVETLILSGSVLPNNYNLSTILDKNVNKIINDCARNDYILILSKIFVPTFSDAGRIGLVGRSSQSEILNRFYSGGHSVYFEKTSTSSNIMSRYWLPVLIDDNHIPQIPEETHTPHILADFIEPILTIWSKIKNVILYLLPIVILIYYFGKS